MQKLFGKMQFRMEAVEFKFWIYWCNIWFMKATLYKNIKKRSQQKWQKRRIFKRDFLNSKWKIIQWTIEGTISRLLFKELRKELTTWVWRKSCTNQLLLGNPITDWLLMISPFPFPTFCISFVLALIRTQIDLNRFGQTRVDPVRPRGDPRLVFSFFPAINET